ncbi:MAG TPA: VanZ family protein [Afipia sp.]
MMLKRISLVAIAWSCLAFIAFATLSPIGLRPHLASAHREYLAAFGALSLLFGLAYPRKPILILVLIVCAAAILETLQVLTIDRHPRVLDFVFKTMGAVCGSLAAAIYRRAISSWSDPRPE